MSNEHPALADCGGPPNPPNIVAMYPDGSEPDDARGIISTICAHGFSPLLVNAVLLDVLRSHFADPNTLLSPLLRQVFKAGGYVQENEDGTGAKSPIMIESLDRWKLTDHEARPAVLVREGKWQQEAIGRGLLSTDVRTGTQQFVTMWQGTVTIFPMSHTPGLAKLLAAEIAKLFVFFGPRLQSEMGFSFFNVLSFGPTARAVEAAANFVCPVDIGFIVDEGWEITVDAAPLKKVEFTLRDVLGP